MDTTTARFNELVEEYQKTTAEIIAARQARRDVPPPVDLKNWINEIETKNRTFLDEKFQEIQEAYKKNVEEKNIKQYCKAIKDKYQDISDCDTLEKLTEKYNQLFEEVNNIKLDCSPDITRAALLAAQTVAEKAMLMEELTKTQHDLNSRLNDTLEERKEEEENLKKMGALCLMAASLSGYTQNLEKENKRLEKENKKLRALCEKLMKGRDK